MQNLDVNKTADAAHNNQGCDVKVITYDELLDDFGALIIHRLDDGTEIV